MIDNLIMLIIGEQVKQIDQLQAELEQEKALKETYLACYKAKHEDIDGELFKLKQTIVEIEEMCSEIDCESLMENSWCGNTDFKMGCCEKLFKRQILQKIRESEIKHES